MTLFSLTLLILAAPQQPGPDLSRDFLMTARDAILLAPAEVACGSVAQSLLWSSDGKHLAVKRSFMHVSGQTISALLMEGYPGAAARGQTEIVVWGAVSKTSKKVLAIDTRTSMLGDYRWLPGSSSLVVEVSSSTSGTAILLVTASGTSKKVGAPGRTRVSN